MKALRIILLISVVFMALLGAIYVTPPYVGLAVLALACVVVIPEAFLRI